MSVKSFKFVSPGVFIHEIDNSFIPKSADAIGPVVIGRATRGLALQPIKVQSYSDFVTMFGDTVPGGGGGDIYRDGNTTSPMYGTYAAKAFLRANVAPLTYVRLLGAQATNNNGSADALAGWKTANNAGTNVAENGGAYGLFVYTSSSFSADSAPPKTGSLAAIWYIDSGSIALSGAVINGRSHPNGGSQLRAGFATGSNMILGQVAGTNEFKILINGPSMNSTASVRFSFDDTKDTFIRKRFNTNPQLGNSNASNFFPSDGEVNYWLGETFEQDLRWNFGSSLTANDGLQACLVAIASGSAMATTTGPQYMKGVNTREAVAGWFIGQDLGTPSSYVGENAQKLFRLKGRGHGEWLQKNVKVAIEKIRQSTNLSSQYGTFSVVLRQFTDTDSNVVVLERFDNCTLDPTSPDFVAKKIGDQYTSWDETSRRLKLYGDYSNQSRFVYVDMNADCEAGATDPTYLPFGYFGPPKFSDILTIWGTGSAEQATYPNTGLQSKISGTYIRGAEQVIDGMHGAPKYSLCPAFVSGGTNVAIGGIAGTRTIDHFESVSIDWTSGSWAFITASFLFPKDNLRVSASDGGLGNPTKAYFGFSTARERSSTRSDRSAFEPLRMWDANWPTDPPNSTAVQGVDRWGYIFTMDDVVQSGSTNFFFYQSGSRALETSYTSGSYQTLLDAGYNRFTAPLWGGFDGFDITKPDPMYNKGMTAGSSTGFTSYEYYTWKRAIDTVADPEAVDMNLLLSPGLTLTDLTTHMVNVCEDRADALAIIDLPDVYIPTQEEYKSSKSDRIGTTPTSAARSLRNRRIDSSYGCTFYPWVQTSDENSGQMLWVPPSVAMLGVLASSEGKSEIWFAPAGFNRGGLTDGAAGIPVTGITERLTSKDRDKLYESSINPIAAFPSTGIVVFGQKTLQEGQSALDRINVRRLVIYLKKQISILSAQILFEQNVQATWNRFKSLIEPFLANVKTKFGITDYKLILDESTTTPDLIDQNIMYAKIMIKPARAIEYIAIDFVIASTGASFDD